MIPNLLEHFSSLKDPRRDHPSKLHKLIDIIVIVLCAVLAKSDTWEEIADYADEKHDFFKTFLELLDHKMHLAGMVAPQWYPQSRHDQPYLRTCRPNPLAAVFHKLDAILER